MNIEDLQKICSRLQGVTTDIKWEHHLCFNVGGKMFLITSPDEHPPTASFKATDEDFAQLAERDGFSPAQYLARYKWIYVSNIELLSFQEWEKFINLSYNLISSRLPKKMQKELGLR